MRNKPPLKPLYVLHPDCSVVVDFQTTHPPQWGKAVGIVKDRKKVLARSSSINHLHIAVVQWHHDFQPLSTRQELSLYLVCHRDVVTTDISVSRGKTSCNANVDLLYKVCSKTIGYTNKDIYIRIDRLKDRAKCRQMRWA